MMDEKPSIQDLDMLEEPKRHAWIENEEQQKKSCLKKMLQPMLIVMAISGCYNFSDIYEIVPKNRHWTMKIALSYIYRTVVFLILLLLEIKNIVSLFNLPSVYHASIGLKSVWILSLIANFLVSLKATSLKYGHLESVFKFWEEKILPECVDLQLECPVEKIKRSAITHTVAACVLVTINFTGLIIQVYMFGADVVILTPIDINPLSLTMLHVCHLVATAMWMIPQAYFVVISKSMTHVFESFNDYLEKVTKGQGPPIQTNLQRLRLLHMDTSKLVSEMDKDLGWFYGLSCTMNMFLSLFSLYHIMKTEMDIFSLVLNIFWFLGGVLITGIPATFAAQLNDEVSLYRTHKQHRKNR